VKRVERAVIFNAAQVRSNGTPIGNGAAAQVYAVGSPDGLYFNQDRVSIVEGRMADPTRADQAVITEQAAQDLRLHVGETVPVGFYTDAQEASAQFGTPAVQPHARINIEVVGIGVFNDAVVQDDAQRSISALVLFTPALANRFDGCCSANGETQFGLQLQPATARAVSAVDTEVERLLPVGAGFYLSSTSVIAAEAQRAIQPESIALAAFGAIAALAMLLIAGQVIGRQLRANADDLATLRSLGADPAMTSSDGLVGVVAAVVFGSVLAGLVAIALSPVGPIGPVRAVYPDRGVAFDWTVLGVGSLAFALLLSAVAGGIAYRQAPHRRAGLGGEVARTSRLYRFLVVLGFPASALTGVRFALESRRRRDVAPVRAAILGAAVAVTVMTATLTFSTSLNTLVSHPRLYGWNWNYELETNEGGGYLPATQAARLLRDDHEVAAFSGVYFDSLRVDGETLPIIGSTPNAPVGPPLLAGHGLEAANQIVLGASTLDALHKRIGDTVQASYGTISKATTLSIVGVATMPAVGPGLGLHLSMGTGALVAEQLIPAAVRAPSSGPPGPNALFVRLRPGVDPTAALGSLQRIAAILGTNPNAGPVTVLAAQRPADIVNYRSMGSMPAVLGIALVGGAVVGMALTLVASVRRRRRDLAVLKTLGFTTRQLAAVVAWQSSIAALIGIIIGIPVGIVLGRSLWDAFAHEINAVPLPAVPAGAIVVVAVGALVLANLVAGPPGRMAARTPTGLLLRAE
jgi:hypothetical protein